MGHVSETPEIELTEAGLTAAAETAVAAFDAAPDLESLAVARRDHLGEDAPIPQARRALGTLPKDQRKDAGRLVNMARGRVEKHFAQVHEALEIRQRAEQLVAEKVDVTVPTTRAQAGALHPITSLMESISDIFLGMGWEIEDGPEVEAEYFNFDALNFLPDHPARTLQDTFHVGPEGSLQVLRTHTSPVQIRAMQASPPPVRILCPGRCYRRDTPDATHGMSFHQIEGLYVDEKVSLADLKGTLAAFAREMFGSHTKIRFRPHFFPFTEPSVECDASCIVCGGTGCRVCKGSGWLEIAGAGMVNPAVFANVGYDPDAVSGYAFGLGLERIAMIRYAINDLRLLYDNDIRFLHQF